MKKSFIPSALHATIAGIAFLAMGTAQAQTAGTNSGEISFSGSITPSTCSVKSGDQIKRVNMLSARPADFKAAGDVKGETPFNITLENCTVGTGIPTKATARFSGTNINSNSRLNNSGTADGVDIAINAGGSNALTTPAQIDLVAGDNVLNFTATYHATKAQIKAGTVLSQVNFDITYQ